MSDVVKGTAKPSSTGASTGNGGNGNKPPAASSSSGDPIKETTPTQPAVDTQVRNLSVFKWRRKLAAADRIDRGRNGADL